MLEALEGFLLVLSATDGCIVYASESLTSLLGHLPDEMTGRSMYELVAEADKPRLYSALQQGAAAANTLAAQSLEDEETDNAFFGPPVRLLLHVKRGGLPSSPPPGVDSLAVAAEHDDNQVVDRPDYELVRFCGYFRKWRDSGGGDGEMGPSGGGAASGCAGSDDDDLSVKSGLSRLSHDASSLPLGGGQERIVLVCTAKLQATRLMREAPLAGGGASPSPSPPTSPPTSVRKTGTSSSTSKSRRRKSSSSSTSRSEFTSRYSLEWKFLYLDHRAPQVCPILHCPFLSLTSTPSTTFS